MIRTLTYTLCLTGTAAAAEPVVVTDIAPVQALVAAVLGSEPEVIVPQSGDPHDFALAPSQARSLANADFVVWVGPTLTPWLTDPLSTLAEDAVMLELIEVPGWEVLPMREVGVDHDDHEDHDDHDHAEHAEDDHDHDEHAKDEDDHDHDHEEHADAHDEHADAHDDDDHAGHGHGDEDPHAWLDPVVLAVWADAVADQLSEIDPDNAATYAANADAYVTRLDSLVAEAPDLSGVSGMLLAHDGYQYLETRFGFAPVAYVTDGHDAEPGPAHLAELRDLVQDGAVTCVLYDTGPEPGWVNALTEGMDIPTGQVSPLEPIETILASLQETCLGT